MFRRSRAQLTSDGRKARASVRVQRGIATRILAGALLFGSACAPVDEPVGAQATGPEPVQLGVRQQPLYVASGTVWVNHTIPVCWEAAGNDVEKTWVRQAVEQSWQRYTGVVFTGWGTCVGTVGTGIRIRSADEWPHTKALGSELGDMANGMVLNYWFNVWAQDTEGKWYQPFSGCIGDARESCIRSLGVHEFGHALGFAHEHNRTDTPSTCTQAPQGRNGDRAIGPWDAMSVMNYCNPVYNNNGNLSAGDIDGATQLYGFPAAGTVCPGRNGSYTQTGVTCGDGKTTALCKTGDTELSVALTEEGLLCGPPRDRWERLRVTRQCRINNYLCDPLGDPADETIKDFDGNGRSDILWIHPATGELSIWYGVDAKGVIARDAQFDWRADQTSGWRVVGTGDFNSDGKVDVLWHHLQSGKLSVWFSNRSTWVAGTAELSWTAAASTGWKVVGTGDFNRDGNTDVLWHHTNGELSVWFLNGTTVASDARLSWTTAESTGWRVRGTGDFNGDGSVDVLWHNGSTGEVGTWYLSGTSVLNAANFSWNSPASNGWELVGTGDFDHDRKIDLLWYYGVDGTVGSWNLDGTTVKDSTFMNWRAAAFRGWKIVSR